MSARLPGTLFLIDSSALGRYRNESVAAIIAGSIDDGVAATCATIDLEQGYSGRDHRSVLALYNTRARLYVNLPVTEVIMQRAREVQQMMAGRGHHRAAGVIDLITAAVAEHHRAIILHYDADFEHIAAVTGQAQQWIVPRGSVD